MFLLPLENNDLKPTLRRILDTAEKLFLSNDYHLVSLNLISKKAGVSKGAIFHYFASKEDLALAVIKNMFHKLDEQYSELFEIKDPRKALEKFIEISLFLGLTENGLSRFLLQISGRLDAEKSKKMFQEVLEPYLQHIAKLFAEIGVDHPYYRAKLLFAALDGIGMYHFLERKQATAKDIQNYFEELVSIYLESTNK